MATDDNQPSLPEKLDDPASDETESKEAQVVAEEQDASVELDESKDDKKEQDDDDADEGGDEDDADEGGEEEEAKGSEKKLKKDAVSEKKTPVTPTSDRPTRERKTVERYSEPSPSMLGRSSSSKGLVIEKGNGTQLKDIPNVAFKLSKRKPDDNLHLLHSILFGKKSKAHNLKRNIGQFSGYVWAENEEKQRAKIKERIDKCVKEKLIVFCDVLNIPINKGSVKKEELSAKLLEFLEAPHATTDVLLAEKEQKAKKRTKKATPSKSPGEASTETPAKKKQTPQSGKKRKHSSDVEEDVKAEPSDAKDDSEEEEDVAVANSGSDDEVDKSEEEEDTSKARKSTSKKSVKEGSVGKAGAKTPSAKKTSAKAAKSSEKSPKSPIPKKSVADQSATKKQKTGNEKQDTKGKAASKTSKAPVKDQVKGKSSKKNKGEPSRADMHAVVVDILKEVDFNTATLSDIIRQLGTHFGLDLMHRKAEVKDIITEVINNMSDEEDEGEEADNDGDGDGDGDAGKDSDNSNEDDAE